MLISKALYLFIRIFICIHKKDVKININILFNMALVNIQNTLGIEKYKNADKSVHFLINPIIHS